MMKKYTTTIIGGGFSGMICAASLNGENVRLLERMDRLGKKLSATGNGQGNLTNKNFAVANYFTFDRDEVGKIEKILSFSTNEALIAFFEELGGLFFADERGRVYPTSRQASSLTDLLRFRLSKVPVEISLSTKVISIKWKGGYFLIETETSNGKEEILSENVVLCAGGKVAKNFGTDGNGYELAKNFGHTVTRLYPALVQLKTETRKTKSLKGIRIANAKVSAFYADEPLKDVRGDLIFTECGVSGDAIFKLSSCVTHLVESGKVRLSVDLLPEVGEESLFGAISAKKARGESESEILCGILNNQVGRAIVKEAKDVDEIVRLIKKFPLNVNGTLGFDYAQVTKGGIPLSEVDENLQSKLQRGLYFAGEILDVDGECGGYNLQWAFSSARAVSDALNRKKKGVN